MGDSEDSAWVSGLDRPVFVLGSGRSGTTLVGELLGQHEDVVYLNEPRGLWNLDPQTNVWRPGPGRIVLTASDLTPEMADGLRRRFADTVAVSAATRIVEKTPINSFRVGYLDALCPDARFLHVVRDGRDVAESIARRASGPTRTGRWRTRLTRRPRPATGDLWYGASDAKWRQLHALADTEGIEVDADGADMFTRGLVEWRLAVTYARRSLTALGPGRSTELRYEDLLERPRPSMSATLEALDLAPSNAVLDAAERRVQPRQHPPVTMDGGGLHIAGSLLHDLGYLD